MAMLNCECGRKYFVPTECDGSHEINESLKKNKLELEKVYAKCDDYQVKYFKSLDEISNLKEKIADQQKLLNEPIFIIHEEAIKTIGELHKQVKALEDTNIKLRARY